MTITNIGILYQGTLTTSAGTTLYTVAAATYANVTSIRITNVGASARTVNIYVKKAGGTARRYSEKDTSLAAGGSVGSAVQVLDDPQELRLGPGDIISGDASANTDCEITITGVELQ